MPGGCGEALGIHQQIRLPLCEDGAVLLPLEFCVWGCWARAFWLRGGRSWVCLQLMSSPAWLPRQSAPVPLWHSHGLGSQPALVFQVHYILQEVVIGGMVLETNMNEIVAQAEAQNKLEKAEVSGDAAARRWGLRWGQPGGLGAWGDVLRCRRGAVGGQNVCLCKGLVSSRPQCGWAASGGCLCGARGGGTSGVPPEDPASACARPRGGGSGSASPAVLRVWEHGEQPEHGYHRSCQG